MPDPSVGRPFFDPHDGSPNKPRRRFTEQTLLRHALGVVRNPDNQIIPALIHLAFGKVAAWVMGFLPFACLAPIRQPAACAAIAALPAWLTDSVMQLWASLLLGATIYGIQAVIVDRTRISHALRHLAYAKKASQ